MDKFEIIKFGPYRFIGKTAYLRSGAPSAVWEALFKDGEDWVLPKLDEMNEYATDETHTVALYNWDRYDQKESLLGYCVGRFMKPDTPVPDNFDFYDIPEILVGKSFLSGESEYTNGLCNYGRENAERLGHKLSKSPLFSAEVFTKPNPNGGNFDWFYEAFEPNES